MCMTCIFWQLSFWFGGRHTTPRGASIYLPTILVPSAEQVLLAMDWASSHHPQGAWATALQRLISGHGLLLREVWLSDDRAIESKVAIPTSLGDLLGRKGRVLWVLLEGENALGILRSDAVRETVLKAGGGVEGPARPDLWVAGSQAEVDSLLAHLKTDCGPTVTETDLGLAATHLVPERVTDPELEQVRRGPQVAAPLRRCMTEGLTATLIPAI